jgi:hypothetical protein
MKIDKCMGRACGSAKEAHLGGRHDGRRGKGTGKKGLSEDPDTVLREAKSGWPGCSGQGACEVS